MGKSNQRVNLKYFNFEKTKIATSDRHIQNDTFKLEK